MALLINKTLSVVRAMYLSNLQTTINCYMKFLLRFCILAAISNLQYITECLRIALHFKLSFTLQSLSRKTKKLTWSYFLSADFLWEEWVWRDNLCTVSALFIWRTMINRVNIVTTLSASIKHMLVQYDYILLNSNLLLFFYIYFPVNTVHTKTGAFVKFQNQ